MKNFFTLILIMFFASTSFTACGDHDDDDHRHEHNHNHGHDHDHDDDAHACGHFGDAATAIAATEAFDDGTTPETSEGHKLYEVTFPQDADFTGFTKVKVKKDTDYVFYLTNNTVKLDVMAANGDKVEAEESEAVEGCEKSKYKKKYELKVGTYQLKFTSPTKKTQFLIEQEEEHHH